MFVADFSYVDMQCKPNEEYWAGMTTNTKDGEEKPKEFEPF
jgi:hypothetical protein